MLTGTRPLGATLFGRAREAVIGLLFLDPGVELHVREIARRAGLAVPTIARELGILRDAGVVRSEARGAQIFFRADPECPLFEDLGSIAVKTWGISGRVAAALEKLPGIESAFIYGSFAKGSAHPRSDVDVLVIGTLDYSALYEAMVDASKAIRRPVDAKLYRPDEWNRKLKEGNSFVASVAGGPKLLLMGSEEVLDAIGKPRKAAANRRVETAPPHPAGNRKSPGGRPRLRKGRGPEKSP